MHGAKVRRGKAKVKSKKSEVGSIWVYRFKGLRV